MLCQEPAAILKSFGGLAESAEPEPFGPAGGALEAMIVNLNQYRKKRPRGV